MRYFLQISRTAFSPIPTTFRLRSLCIFIKYKDEVKGDKLWNPVTMKIVYSRYVIFKEVEGNYKVKYVKKEK